MSLKSVRQTTLQFGNAQFLDRALGILEGLYDVPSYTVRHGVGGSIEFDAPPNDPRMEYVFEALHQGRLFWLGPQGS